VVLRQTGAPCLCVLLLFTAAAAAVFCALSLHDALPICVVLVAGLQLRELRLQDALVGGLQEIGARRDQHVLQPVVEAPRFPEDRSEEHTSELQSRENLVCRLLLEKKKNSVKHLRTMDLT